MEVRSKTQSLIKETALEATRILAESYQGTVLDNLHIAIDKESGEVLFYDLDENCIASIVIDEWMGKTCLPDSTIISVLRSVIGEIEDDHGFDLLEIYKPFSVNYSDESLNVIEKLALIGDDMNSESDNDLLEKFDREFDEFLDKLLKE